MKSMSKLMAGLVIAAMLFMMVFGFAVGVQYQKEQPVTVDVISFVNGTIVNNQTFLHPVDMNELTFLSDDHYYWDRNVSFYAIVISHDY